MREIKFRAWDKITKKMYKVSSIHIEDEYVDLFEKTIYEGEFKRKFSEIVLMQYTGVSDKNGAEICEHEFVKMSGKVWIVEWCKKYCQFRLSNATESTGLNFYRSNDYEVIGNKFDNPELLEGY